METQIFYLYNKIDYIKVIPDSDWSSTIVYKNEERLGEIVGKENLEFGKPFQTSDNKIVYVRLKKSFFGKHKIEVLINGSAYNKKEVKSKVNRIRAGYTNIFFISALSVAVGLISIFIDNSEIRKMDFGYQSVIFGFVYVCLGFLFYKKNSWVTLIFVIIVLVIDTLLLLKFKFEPNHLYNFRYGLFARAYFLYLAISAVVDYYKVEKLKIINAS